MGTNNIAIKIANTVEEAPDYKKLGGWQHADCKTAVIVRNGTEGGNDTVDLQFTDEKGNKFVAMLTANILKTIADLTITNRN